MNNFMSSTVSGLELILSPDWSKFTPYLRTWVDHCHNNRVDLFYKDGSKYTFKEVERVEHCGDKSSRMVKVYGRKLVTNQIDTDIVEDCNVAYVVKIPKHHVDHYVVHGNNGVTKTERVEKVL